MFDLLLQRLAYLLLHFVCALLLMLLEVVDDVCDVAFEDRAVEALAVALAVRGS